MRLSGEPVSLTIGETTVKIGTADAIIATKIDGRTVTRLWLRPYWPGMLHAIALISDGRKRTKAKG